MTEATAVVTGASGAVTAETAGATAVVTGASGAVTGDSGR